MTYALMSEGLVTVLLCVIPGSQSSQIGILCSVEVILVPWPRSLMVRGRGKERQRERESLCVRVCPFVRAGITRRYSLNRHDNDPITRPRASLPEASSFGRVSVVDGPSKED